MTTQTEKIYLTWTDVDLMVRGYGQKLIDENRVPATILAIGTGGLSPATILAKKIECKTLLNFGIATRKGTSQIQAGYEGIYQWPPTHPAPKGPILIVDDLWDTGYTLGVVDKALGRLLKPEVYQSIQYYTMLRGTKNPITPTFQNKLEYSRDFDNNKWVVFPWE